MLLGGKGAFFTELKRRCFGEKANFHRVEKALLRRKSGFITELKRRCFGGKADLSRSRKGVVLEEKADFSQS